MIGTRQGRRVGFIKGLQACLLSLALLCTGAIAAGSVRGRAPATQIPSELLAIELLLCTFTDLRAIDLADTNHWYLIKDK